MRHGYYITAQVLASERGVLMPLPIPKWDIPEGSWAKTTAPHAIARTLQGSARRRLRLFSVRDWVSWVQLGLVTLTVVALIALSPRIIKRINSVIAGIEAYPLTRYKPPEWTDPPQVPIATVAQIERPKNEGFLILSDDRVWDLRHTSGHDSSSGIKTKTGPALLTRISKLKRGPNANQYKYLYQTAATKFEAWSPKKDVTVKLLHSAEQTASGDNLLSTYELQLDVSNFEVNKEFILMAQAKTNAPWDRNNTWVGMSITDSVPAASMRIIFPKDLQAPVFRKYPNDSSLQAGSFNGIVLDSVAEQELLWRADHHRPGWTYRVQWDWNSDWPGTLRFGSSFAPHAGPRSRRPQPVQPTEL